MFDLLLNLRLQNTADMSVTASGSLTPKLSTLAASGPSSGTGGLAGRGVGASLTSLSSSHSLAASFAIAHARQALNQSTVYIPNGLHVSVAASFPFMYAEHRAPTLRAVKRLSRAAMTRPPPQPMPATEGTHRTEGSSSLSKTKEKSAAVGAGEGTSGKAANVEEEEEVYSWTLAALPGFYVLPTALGAIIRCLRHECKVDAFTVRLEAEMSGGRWLPSSVFGALGPRKQNTSATGPSTSSSSSSTGMRLLARGAGSAAAPSVLSQSSVPLLCFSRLSSEGWIDDAVRQLHASSSASKRQKSDVINHAEDDASDTEGDLEFYPAAIHFRRAELLTVSPARATYRKRSRSGEAAVRSEERHGDAGPKEFAIDCVVVYAPLGPAADDVMPPLEAT